MCFERFRACGAPLEIAALPGRLPRFLTSTKKSAPKSPAIF